MTYWQHVQTAAGVGGWYHWVLMGGVSLTILLAIVVPAAIRRLRATLILFLLSLPGFLVCAFYLQHDEANTATYRWTHFGSQLVLAMAIINLAGVVLFRVLLASVRLRPAPILHDTILGLAYVAIALTLLGHHVDLTGIVATSAVVTAVIGFSLQDTLGNIIGGMALQVERSICVGDWIRAGDIEGVVREIRWRQTSIETRNWDTVVIPNSVLMKSQVTVLGRREGKPKLHRMWVYFNVDLRYSPAEVIEAVEKAMQIEEIPNVASEPRPDCILKDFKDNYGVYAVRYWLSDFAKDDPTSSEVRTRIVMMLQRAGMCLAIPAQDVRMTMEARNRSETQQQEEMRRRIDAINGAPIFAPLTEEERAHLATHLSIAPFRRGEIITRQGNVAHYLYIICRGEAQISVSLPTGESQQLAIVGVGQVFGEMGLMTGEPRFATVTALTDVLCYRLDKPGFAEILERRPEIAQAMSRIVAERRVQLDMTTRSLTEEAKRTKINTTQNDVLNRIREFFTLD